MLPFQYAAAGLSNRDSRTHREREGGCVCVCVIEPAQLERSTWQGLSVSKNQHRFSCALSSSSIEGKAALDYCYLASITQLNEYQSGTTRGAKTRDIACLRLLMCTFRAP
jgi:hypothetical protein